MEEGTNATYKPQNLAKGSQSKWMKDKLKSEAILKEMKSLPYMFDSLPYDDEEEKLDLSRLSSRSCPTFQKQNLQHWVFCG